MPRRHVPYHQRKRFWRRLELTALVVMALSVLVLLWALFA